MTTADKLDPQRVGQFPPLAEQFPGDLGRLPFGLLDEDPDTAVGGELAGQRSGLGVALPPDRRSPCFAKLVEDLLLFRGEEHLQGLGRADLDALDAADAFLRDR